MGFRDYCIAYNPDIIMWLSITSLQTPFGLVLWGCDALTTTLRTLTSSSFSWTMGVAEWWWLAWRCCVCFYSFLFSLWSLKLVKIGSRDPTKMGNGHEIIEMWLRGGYNDFALWKSACLRTDAGDWKSVRELMKVFGMTVTIYFEFFVLCLYLCALF